MPLAVHRAQHHSPQPSQVVILLRMKVTPLLGFLRALTVEQQNAMAAEVGTTRVYLYQLAGQPQPNPRLRFALMLVAATRRWGKRVMAKPLALEDLLVGTEDDPFPAPARSND